MRGKYKNKKLIKDNGNDETNTQSISYIEVPVEVYEKNVRTRAAIRSAIVPIVIFVLMLCVGVVLIIRGAAPDLFRDKSYVATQAIVVKYEWRYHESSTTSHSGGWMQHAVFNYVYEGKEYSHESRVAVEPLPFEVGETMTIYVNPNDPTDIVTPIADKSFIIFGSALLVFSLFAIFILALRPILCAAYPQAKWTKFVTLYIPLMVFIGEFIILFAVLNFTF